MQQFIEAVTHNKLSKLYYLISFKDIDYHFDDDYLFRLAIEKQHNQMIRDFVNVFNVNLKANNNFAIRYSSEKNNTEIIILLILKGCRYYDLYKNAINFNNKYLIKTLLENKIEYNKYVVMYTLGHNSSLEILQIFIDDGINYHCDDDYIFRWAAEHGFFDKVKFLLSNGANIHANRDDALRSAAKKGHLKIVKYLVGNGADIHASNNDSLIQAIIHDHFEIVKFLIKAGTNINNYDDNIFPNENPLCKAILYKRTNIIKYLISLNCDITDDAIELLIIKYDLDIIKDIISVIPTKINYEYMIEMCIKYNTVELFKFITTYYYPINTNIIKLLNTENYINKDIIEYILLEHHNTYNLISKTKQKTFKKFKHKKLKIFLLDFHFKRELELNNSVISDINIIRTIFTLLL